MQRQILLNVKEKYKNIRKVDCEINGINKMFIHIESFKAFCETNLVFDVQNHMVIKSRKRLFDIYKYGVTANSFIYVLGTN